MADLSGLNPGSFDDFVNKIKGQNIKQYEDVTRSSEPAPEPSSEPSSGGDSGEPIGVPGVGEIPSPGAGDSDSAEKDENNSSAGDDPGGSFFEDDEDLTSAFIMEIVDEGGAAWLGWVAKEDPEMWLLQKRHHEKLRKKLQTTLEAMNWDVDIHPGWKLLIAATIIYLPLYKKAAAIGKQKNPKKKPAAKKPGNNPGQKAQRTDPEEVIIYEENEHGEMVEVPFNMTENSSPDNSQTSSSPPTVGEPHPNSWVAKGKPNPLNERQIARREEKGDVVKCTVCKTNPVKDPRKDNPTCSTSCNGVKRSMNMHKNPEND